mgnify:CR=1 FL=1
MAGTRKKAAATGTRGTATKGRAAAKRGCGKRGIATKRGAKSKARCHRQARRDVRPPNRSLRKRRRQHLRQRRCAPSRATRDRARADQLDPAGLAARLDFQAVVDLIGDQLRVLFATPDLSISWFDESANLVRTLYACEAWPATRVAAQRAPARRTATRSMRKSRVPHVLNRSLDYKRYNLTPVPGADNSKSMLSVPIVVGDRFLGDISIENFERENAFAPPDIRLVSTVADRVGAALENARDSSTRRSGC